MAYLVQYKMRSSAICVFQKCIKKKSKNKTSGEMEKDKEMNQQRNCKTHGVVTGKRLTGNIVLSRRLAIKAIEVRVPVAL